MFTAFLVPYLSLTFLLVPLFYFSFSDTSHILLHTFLYLLLFLATSNFLLLTPLSSIFLYVLLLAHYGVTRLFLLSILHSLAFILFLPLILNLSLPTIPLLLTLFLLYLLQVILLLPQLNYKFILL